MKILSTIALTYQASVKALKYSPYAVAIVVAAEGVQHIAEWRLGMFESIAAFEMHSSDTLRLAFGIVKALAVLIAIYLISKKLFCENGPQPRYGTFNKDLLRKLWDPRGSAVGILAMFAYAVPLIFIHYQLNFLAIGKPVAPVFLVIDSVVVGFIALTIAAAYWAGEAVNSNSVTTNRVSVP